MKSVGLLLLGLTVVSAVGANTAPDFDREVRPILSDNCYACHGPDEKRRMAGLRLDVKESAFSESKRGKIVAPGEFGAQPAPCISA